MDTMFVMIIMGAGVAVALLGMFLLASERELKAKKRDIEILLDKLENTSQTSVLTQNIQSEAEHPEVAELRAQNRALQNQLAALTEALEQSRGAAADLQASQRMDANSQIEKQELNAANERLSREVHELRSRLAAGEAQSQSASASSHEEATARMQAQINDLRRAIQEKDIKLSELESARQNLPDVSAIETRHRQEQESQRQQISELERQNALNAEKLAELQSMRDRLAEAENIHNSLRDEIQRHQAEIPKWQSRIAAAEENRQRLAALQGPCNELLSKQAALADRQRQLQEELVSFARLINAANNGAPQLNTPADESQKPHVSGQSPGAGPVSAGNSSSASPPATEMRAAQDMGVEPTGSPAPAETPGRRFGLLGILLLLAAAGALSFKLFVADAERTVSPTGAANTVADARVPAPAMVAKSPQSSLENQPGPLAAQTEMPTPVKRPVGETAEAANNRLARAEPASLGTYQVVRPSPVYAAPNEFSRAIGEIEPGVNVNVVNSRDGWLEIHSKHGRPPGFIRREVAAKVSSRN
jgi:predicted  nucleic acid-binding Zn-ribbon protein